MMYDELIKRLRETSVDFGESDHVSVMMIEAADAIEELRKELRWCKNELCLKCGDYKQSYLGACDDCRWYVMNEEVI